MFNLTKQEQLIILFLIGILLVGLGVKHYFNRQHNPEIIVPITTATDTSNRNTNQSPIIVHIAGAVNKPGVYHLPAGSRIYDAITTAGDTTFQADVSDLNLAMVIEDGDKIEIPIMQSNPDPKPEPISKEVHQQSFSPPEPMSKTKSIPNSRLSAQSSGKININTATVSELDILPGIGPKLAERIILYRQQHGPFKRIDDIVLVSGIGPKRFEQMKNQITVK
ncbi:MAG: helix-hairpin-helix domain-containing protein [bacterium]